MHAVIEVADSSPVGLCRGAGYESEADQIDHSEDVVPLTPGQHGNLMYCVAMHGMENHPMDRGGSAVLVYVSHNFPCF